MVREVHIYKVKMWIIVHKLLCVVMYLVMSPNKSSCEIMKQCISIVCTCGSIVPQRDTLTWAEESVKITSLELSPFGWSIVSNLTRTCIGFKKTPSLTFFSLISATVSQTYLHSSSSCSLLASIHMLFSRRLFLARTLCLFVLGQS